MRARTEEHECNRSEIEKYGDIEMLSEICTNGRRIIDMQTSFGKLHRVCVLGDVKWTEREPRTKACNFVQLEYRNTNGDNEKSMHILPEASGRVRSKRLGGSLPMLVDTFEDESIRRNIASSIRCDLPTNSCDPEKLIYNYEYIAEFGFNHIIVNNLLTTRIWYRL